MGPIRLIRRIGPIFQSTGKVALHSGYPEQPQNCEPALGPLRAVRSIMGLPQEGQGFLSDGSDRSD